MRKQHAATGERRHHVRHRKRRLDAGRRGVTVALPVEQVAQRLAGIIDSGLVAHRGACAQRRIDDHPEAERRSLPRPEAATRRAFTEARACDVLLTVGSSLLVYPAADLVPTAHAAGAKIILINLQPTPFDDLADVVIRGKAGQTLAALTVRA